MQVMSGTEQEQPLSQTTSLPIEWHIPDNLQSRYANNILVQSSEHEFIVSFFEAQVPPFVGPPDENAVRLKQLGVVRAECVARIIVNPDLFPAFVNALQVGLQ